MSEGKHKGPEKKSQTKLRLECKALFDGLIDIVEDGKTRPAFLVKEGERLRIRNSVEHGDKLYVPPPRDQIPWNLPSGNAVIGHYQFGPDAQLYDDLRTYHRENSELPTEAYYDLLTAWVFHTYLQEQITHTPIIVFDGAPEHGKTRAGKGAILVACRGVHVETLREAHILRLAGNFSAPLFFDVRDLSRKAERLGSEDIMLGRFEKGIVVPRVLHLDRGPFKDTEYFQVFGPTLIATNDSIDRILETRAIVIPMLESAQAFALRITPERALPLKERLLAFRARHLNRPLPEIEKSAPGRLGDIMKPLIQAAQLARPEAVQVLIELTQRLASHRLSEGAPKIEVCIVAALARLRSHQLKGRLLPVKAITDEVNMGQPSGMIVTPHRVGHILHALGFSKDRTSENTAAVIWDEALVERLKAKYAISQKSPGSPETPA